MSVSFSTIIQKARPAPLSVTSHALREALAMIPPTTVSKLGNGTTIATEENPNAKFATVGIWTQGGARFDKRNLQGASKLLHFAGLEGTKNLDKTALTNAIDELGGQLTIEHGREQSFIALKVFRNDVPKAVKLLAEIYQDARLSDADVAATKATVATQLKQSGELVDHLVMDNLHVCAYDASEQGGLGNHVYGTVEGIEATTANDLRELRAQQVVGKNTQLVGTGAVSHKELEQLAQAHLGGLKESGRTVKPDETRFVGGDIRLWNLRTGVMNAAWAVETSGALSADTTVFKLMTQIHGNYERNQHEYGQHALHRLVKTHSNMDHGTPTNTHFSEKTVESLSPFFESYQDTGLFGMYVVGRNQKAAPHLARSMAETLEWSAADFARIANKCLVPEELEQAKVNMKAQLMFNLDGQTNTAKDLAQQVHKYGRRVPLDEWFARIDDVEGHNVQEVLNHYFANRKPVFSLYGNFFGTLQYDVLQHNFAKYFY